MDKDSSHSLDAQFSDSFGAARLSVAVIGPDDGLRNAVAKAFTECQQGGDVREFASYPPGLDDVPRLLEQHYDVIIIELDSNPEYALELVEGVCANGVASVMVYSESSDPELLVRCMRAGAREFLTLPIARNTMAEALVRAAARRPANRPVKRGAGRLLVFFGAKGGAGVTILACNFAVALAQDPSQKTLLIDLDLPLGDAALNLGLDAEYSTVNALQESSRLDASFLSKLLVKHSSGLYVLAAPGRLPQYPASDESIDRLMAVARQDFDNVVVDVGSRLDFAGSSLFKDARTIYLVTQAGIPELRNSNRLISQFFPSGGSNLEVVINRFQPRALGVGDEHITKALTRPAQWQIPNDYGAVRQMQNTATPLVLEDSPISRLIREMARSVTGQSNPQDKEKERKKGFSFRSLGRGSAAKSSAIPGDEFPAYPRVTPVAPFAAARPAESRASAVSSNSSNSSNSLEPIAFAPLPRKSSSSGIRPLANESSPVLASERTRTAESEREASPITAVAQQAEPQTRTYKGVTYIKGTDGQWHIQSEDVESGSSPAPSISWADPAPIVYGTPLGKAQCDATASVPGIFTYTPSEGQVLPAGTHTLWVSFTPQDGSNDRRAHASVPLTVIQATPSIFWPTPEEIASGVALDEEQLNATASVPGTFTYKPDASTVLEEGVHLLSAYFTPSDGANYTAAEAAVQIAVTRETPTITWPTPAPVPYGTALGPAQLNATASVPGVFTYSPSVETVLEAGTHTLSATFAPADAAGCRPAQATVLLTVVKALPAVTWEKPEPIFYGTPLGPEQLNATASVEGRFVYIPRAGAVLSAGAHSPSVIFTPADGANYTAARASVPLTVAKATPEILWPHPEPISYGTALGAKELNATASVPGTFVYTPGAGELLEEGTHTLAVAFTPADSADYTAAEATASLTVTKATPALAWPQPAPIPYGVALGDAQLNATAPVAGTFAYTPNAGETLQTGVHTLSVTFTPTEATDYTAAEASVQLTVTKAAPRVVWMPPEPIIYGAALSAAQLNATAPVPGTFVYTPAVGELLRAGRQTLTAAFTPEDEANYTVTEVSVPLEVAHSVPVLHWTTPSSIPYGTPLSETELNVTASVPGTFAYTPAVGTVLAPGTQMLSVTFLPADQENYRTVHAQVALVIEDGLPAVVPAAPAAAKTEAVETESEDNEVDGDELFPPFRVENGGMKNEKNRLDSRPARAASPTPFRPFRRFPALEPATAEVQSIDEGKWGVSENGATPRARMEPETRIYKGATYVKGADGQWHVKQK